MQKSTSARRVHMLTGSLALFLCALFAGAAEVAAQQPTRIQSEPSSLTLRVGESAAVQVRALGADGQVVSTPVQLVGPRQQLSVSDGMVEALAVGEHELIATVSRPGLEALTLRIPVTVNWPVIAEIELRADRGRLYEGTSLGHRVEARHADGTTRPQPRVSFRSSDPSVAMVDELGTVTANTPGRVVITASMEGVDGQIEYLVEPFPGADLQIEGGADGVPSVRTGDVLQFMSVLTDANGRAVDDAPVAWSHTFRSDEFSTIAGSAAGQMNGSRFVADVPGTYTVFAQAGPLSARSSFRVEPRDVVKELDLIGHGQQNTMRTTDFWVFEGVDGRDYVITGSKVADGHAFVFDVTNPGNIIKTDSVQVDARAVNDVKVSPDGRYATMTREGASDRRNGVVILDLADPAHPVIAAEVTERLTGGVHNAFPTDDHVFALSNGDKFVILDVSDIYNPQFVSEYDHPDSRLHDVWVHDGLAFSAEWETGIVVVDVGNGRWGGSIENPVFVSSYPLPTGRTHAVFPYFQESTGKYYLFAGDEIMSRGGLAWSGYPRSMGSYADRYDPEAGVGGIPLTTQGYIQVVDFTDPENAEMVARYEVTEFGTHNIWVEDDVLYQGYYEGGLRVVDVSGELMGNLYTQGREMAVFKSADPNGYVPNSTMVWSAMPFKGHVFFSDTNSGIWAVKLQERGRPISD